MGRHALIIGGGVGGLSAAIRLAAAGHRVTLIEMNSRVGGKLNLWEIPHPGRPLDRPFRFDTGPSLLTMPFVFEELFRAAGRDMNDYLTLHRLDPIARYRWADGSTLDARAAKKEMDIELARFAPDDLSGWNDLLSRGRRIWDLSAELFLYHAPEQLMQNGGGFRGVARAIAVPFQIGMFSNFAKLIHRHLKNPKLREVMYQFATYSGASPFRAPATLAVIPHAEFEFGGWSVEGGMYRLAEALARLAAELGVETCLDAPVDRILIEPGKTRPQAVGVRLGDGREFRADCVIANSDVVYTYRDLIEARFRPKYTDRTLDKIEPGGSGMCLLLGVDGAYLQLAHHNKFMPVDYRHDLDAMFEKHAIPDDPSIYVCASTRTDSSQAPDGCENLFVLASAPALDGRLSWDVEGPRYRDQLVKTLEERWGLKDLSKRIVVERRLTPMDLKSLYNANAGSIYGIGSNNRRSAFLRPPNRDRHVRNLFFAGGATHPGGGLPLVALSGKIVSELVLDHFGST